MHRVHADRHYAPVSLPRRAKPRGPVRDFRARGKLKLVEVQVTAVAVEIDRCGLCEGAIDRFDGHAFEANRRCCGCRAALQE